MSSALRVQRLLPHISTSLSLSLSLFNLLFLFGGVNISDARQTARPLDYKLQIETVLRFDASKVNSQAFIYDSVFLFFFFFSKTNTIPKIPSSFLLINENRKQNAKPKTLLSPQSSHLHYTYFCTFSEFIHSQVRFLLILAT